MTRISVRGPLLALALLTFSLALLWRGEACAQVSPGPLAAPHASLEGSLQCLKCHGPGGSWKGMDDKCLACHTEIGWMKTANRGFHSRLPRAKNCATCHPDHGGREFQLVQWDEGSAEKFDHRRTGYLLEGKHATLQCRDCHKPAFQKSPAAPLIRRKDRAKSWLGLQTACADCHTDPHRGQLGNACTKCHGQTAWKPAPGFDHAKSAYPLTGAHEKVECAKCHASAAVAKGVDAQGKPIAQWKPLPHNDCVSCHKDPHAGRFPGACSKCHVTSDFHTIGKQNFNHELTRYPLRGKHASVACEKCHDAGAGGPKPKFALCTDCHKDAHAGTATLAGKAVDCAACHDVKGFENSIYTAAQHQQSAYPLEGRHAAAECAKCHVQKPAGAATVAALGTARVVMRPVHGACVDCHADPHAGRFRPTGARPQKNDCRACHDLGKFRPSNYDDVMHAGCVFRLEGAHQAVPCQSCHDELKAPASRATLIADAPNMRPLRFDNPRRACVDCHKSPHGEQFAHRKDKGACDGCHGAEAFAPAGKFDHNKDSAFKLEGAHLKTECASCHPSNPGPDGKPVTIYRPTPTKCEACHAAGEPDSTATPKSRMGVLAPRRHADRPVPMTTREALYAANH